MKRRPNKSRHTHHVALSVFAASTLLLASWNFASVPRASHSVFAAAQSGGSIAVRNDSTPDCLDPQKSAIGASFFVYSAIFDTLVSANTKGKLYPDLALRWTFSKGGTVVTFFLRHGVRFSNGDPFTAQDVKATFDRMLDPATKAPYAGELGSLKETKVIAPYTVQLVLKAPFRPIMANLAYQWESILDVKAMTAEGNKACQQPIGTGPFKVQSVGPGFSTVTLVRNPLHTWESAQNHNRGKPYLDKIVFQSVTSDTTAVSELLTGALDFTDLSGSQIGRVQHNANIRIYKSSYEGENYLGFNMSRPPFNKLAVRKAIAEAIDRSAIVKAAVNGFGKPVYSPIPFSMADYDKGAKKYLPPYNPNDARQILAANHVTGPYTLLAFNLPRFATAAELIQAELAAVGVKVNVVTQSIADYIGTASKGNFDLNLLGWGANDPDYLYSLFHSSQENGNGINFTFFKSPTIDKLIIKGRETTNAKKAATYYAQLQRYMNKNVIVDPLWVDVRITATRTRLKGFRFDVTGTEPIWPDLYVTK